MWAPVPIGQQPDDNQWEMRNGRERELSPASGTDAPASPFRLGSILPTWGEPQILIQRRTNSLPHNLIMSSPWTSLGSWLSSSQTPRRWDKNRCGIPDLISPILGVLAFVSCWHRTVCQSWTSGCFLLAPPSFYSP